MPTAKPRPSVPRIPSPERIQAWGSSSVMGPPSPGGFVRKTRKSMAGMQLDLARENDLDSMVPLAESETPMIRKNKELREAQSRRSSLGMRGQRASTSLGRGDASESIRVV